MNQPPRLSNRELAMVAVTTCDKMNGCFGTSAYTSEDNKNKCT